MAMMTIVHLCFVRITPIGVPPRCFQKGENEMDQYTLNMLNHQTRVANGCIDTRPGAYGNGGEGHYQRSGVYTSQSRIDDHNRRVFSQNNGQLREKDRW